MSITVKEKFESRETTEGQAIELVYVIEGTDSDTAAMAALKADAPASYNQMTRQNCRIEPIGPDIWLGVAPYVPPEAASLNMQMPQTGDVLTRFDTAGGTQHITQSRENLISSPASGEVPRDYKGAIGVSGDADDQVVEGVDVTVPVYNFSQTHYLPDTQVTEAYKGKLFRLTGKTNNAPFKALAAGECLFLGASGSKRSEDDWEVTFGFAASENKTNWQPPSFEAAGLSPIDKKGWDYLWFQYATRQPGGADKPILKVPIGVYVERVYDEGDFSQLGIGT